MGLYEQIREIAKSKGYSVNRLEKELGFARSSINKFNKNAPSIDKLHKIADFLGVSVDYLMAGKEPSETKEIILSEKEKRYMEYAKIFWDMGLDSDELKALMVLAKKYTKKD